MDVIARGDLRESSVGGCRSDGVGTKVLFGCAARYGRIVLKSSGGNACFDGFCLCGCVICCWEEGGFGGQSLGGGYRVLTDESRPSF